MWAISFDVAHILLSETMPKFFLLLLLSSLFACAQPLSEPPLRSGQYYTYLSRDFIVDLAAGSTILLDPSARDFPLFSSVEEAKAGRARALREGKLPAGDWRIYRLEPSALAQERADGYVLGRTAAVSDWIPE